RVVEAGEQPLTLFFLRHVQEELADDGGVAIEMALKGADVVEALRPEVRSQSIPRQLSIREQMIVHADDQDRFVVGGVEEGDAASGRERPRRAPQKIVRELLG